MTKEEALKAGIEHDQALIGRELTPVETLLWLSGFSSGQIFQLDTEKSFLDRLVG